MVIAQPRKIKEKKVEKWENDRMKELPNLKELTEEVKEALIVELWEKAQKLEKPLEKKPKKTLKNSSLPPARGFKAQTKSGREREWPAAN